MRYCLRDKTGLFGCGLIASVTHLDDNDVTNSAHSIITCFSGGGCLPESALAELIRNNIKYAAASNVSL
jgi:hypothetical protein